MIAFGFAAGVGVASSASLGCDRMLRAHVFGWLVLAQPLEGRLADHASTRPAGKLDLGDQHRLDPIPILLFARRILARERAFVGDVGF